MKRVTPILLRNWRRQRICCGETEWVRQLRTDELYAQKKDEPSTVSQLLSHIQDLQDKVKPWMERKNSIIRKQRAALECPTFPVNPREFWLPDVCFAAVLYTSTGNFSSCFLLPELILHKNSVEVYCRTIHGTRWELQETFLKIYLAKKGCLRHYPVNQRIWHFLLAKCTWKCNETWREGLRREPQSSTIPTPRFARNHDLWNPMHRTGGTHSQSCMMEAPRYAISELHFGTFPDPDDFQCWRVNFKTEVGVWVHSSISSQCRGSMKWRWQDQQTILWLRNQLKGEETSLILKCLMRGLRLRWEESSLTPPSEEESVSKSSELKNTPDSWERRHIAYMIYGHFQPELMMQLKVCRMSSILACRMMTSNIS